MKNYLKSIPNFVTILLVECFIIMLLLKQIVNILLQFNPQVYIVKLLLYSALILALVFFIFKIFSAVSKSLWIKILPTSYSITFYLLNFLMILDDSKSNITLSDQLTMLGLYFILTEIINECFDSYKNL